MSYPHYSVDCDEHHDLVRDFGPDHNIARVHAIGSDARYEAGRVHRPEIVCLCGSTKFYGEFQRANFDLTMQGKIVLSVGFYPNADPARWAIREHGETVGITPDEKIKLDELHKRKIDLADYVHVLNVGGYIGASTRSEIEYATSRSKPVEYLEPLR